MAKSDRRFNCWNSVQLVLKRGGVQSHGSTATLLLETFVEDSGRLTASKVVARGLCKEGEFWSWRKSMIEKGWLNWSEQQPDKGQYFPGKKLIPYINKEKLYSKEIATKDEVASRAEFQDLKERMNRIEEVVQELKEAVAPPDTDEKRAMRERAARKLETLAKAN